MKLRRSKKTTAEVVALIVAITGAISGLSVNSPSSWTVAIIAAWVFIHLYRKRTMPAKTRLIELGVDIADIQEELAKNKKLI